MRAVCACAAAYALAIVTFSFSKDHAMHRTLTFTPHPAAAVAAFRWRAWLRHAWDALTLDADERFLHGACDLADLERRQRCLERGRAERFGPLDPHA